MKRKLSSPRTALKSPGGNTSPLTKRRKHEALEANFSSLSLDATDIPGSSEGLPDSSEPLSDDPFMAGDVNTDPLLTSPSSVEDLRIPEVKMKSSSWYEPEPDRIIITDLDSSSDSDEENTDPDNSFISISPALLRRISSHSHHLMEPVIPSPGANQALVLFRPLPVAGITIIDKEPETKEQPTGRCVIDDVVREDDAMDIEPW